MYRYTRSTLALTVVSVAVILVACNSGGSSNDTTKASLSNGAAAHSALQAVNAVGVGMGSFAGASTATNSRARHAKNIRQAITQLNTKLRSINARASAAVAPMVTTVNCTVSGTQSFSSTADTTTETYIDCIENSPWSDTNGNIVQATLYQNGTRSFTFSMTGFSETLGTSGAAFTERYTNTANSKVLEESVDSMTTNGTFSAAPACDNSTVTMAVTMTGSSAYKYDGDANGTLDENGSATFTALALDVSMALDSNCDPSTSTVKMTGTIAGVDNLNAANSVTITSTAANPFTETDTYLNGQTSSVLSGAIAVVSKCASGTLTYATTQPMVTIDGDPCPISGKINITGDVNVAVTFNSDGSVDVGSTHFKSCEDANVCT